MRPNIANIRSSISSEKPPSSGSKSSKLLQRLKNHDWEFLTGVPGERFITSYHMQPSS